MVSEDSLPSQLACKFCKNFPLSIIKSRAVYHDRCTSRQKGRSEICQWANNWADRPACYWKCFLTKERAKGEPVTIVLGSSTEIILQMVVFTQYLASYWCHQRMFSSDSSAVFVGIFPTTIGNQKKRRRKKTPTTKQNNSTNYHHVRNSSE